MSTPPPPPTGWEELWAGFAARQGARVFRCSFVEADQDPPASEECASRNPGRRREWWAGRRALAEAGRGLEGGARSLSHSHGLALAVALGGDGPARVGVDLEPVDRKMAPGVLGRIFAQPERTLGLGGLEGWVIKEAAYKANAASAGTWLPQYRIMSASGAVEGTREVEGGVLLPEEGGPGREAPFLLLRGGGWLGCLVVA